MSIRRILIVDSDTERQYQIKAILGEIQLGNVTLANSGEIALDKIEPKRIDLIITAWEMKPMSGKIFVQRLWSKKSFRNIPMIIYSSNIGVHEFRLLQELNIKHILPVPMIRTDLKDKMNEILENDKNFDPTQKKLQQAKTLIGEGSLEEALALIQPLKNIPALEDECFTLLGEIHLLKADYPSAEKHLNDALQNHASKNHPRQLLAKLYSETGRHAMAIDLLVQLVNHSPLNVNLAILLGEAQESALNLQLADKAYKQALEIDPENPQARINSGVLALKQGQLAVAKEFLRLDGQDKLIIRRLNNQAIGLSAKELFEESFSLYRGALKIAPNASLGTLISYNLGLAYKKSKRLLEAFKLLGDCVIHQPDFEKAYESFVGVTREMNEEGIEYDTDFAKSVKSAKEGYHQSA